MSVDTKNTGLRGIPVADTRISNINGKLGKLIYRGYDIEDLAEKSTFEETAYLLLHDHLPTKARYNKFLLNLNDSRVIPKQMQTNMCNWRKDADPMDMLQAFVAALAGYYDEEFSNKEASYERAVNIIAKVPTIVCNVRSASVLGLLNHLDLREICYSEPLWADDHVIADMLSPQRWIFLPNLQYRIHDR